MRAMLGVVVLVLGCGAATGTIDPTYGDAGAPTVADAASSTCLPTCLQQMFEACPPPTGDCGAYLTAAPDNWQRCFANGLVVEAQNGGNHRYRQGGRVCATLARSNATSIAVDEWSDTNGNVATILRPFNNETQWRVTCGRTEYQVDTRSTACANNPWVRGYNPHGLRCPLTDRACRQ